MKRCLLILLIIFSLVFLFTGCVTQKACNRKFPVQTEVIVKDSVVTRDSIVYRDTLIKTVVTITDTTYRDSTVIVYQQGAWQSKPVTIKGKYSDAEAFVKNGKVYVNLHEGGAIELTVLLRKAIIERNIYKELWHSTAITKVVKERYVPRFVRVLAWTGGVTIALVIGYILLLFWAGRGIKIEL